MVRIPDWILLSSIILWSMRSFSLLTLSSLSCKFKIICPFFSASSLYISVSPFWISNNIFRLLFSRYTQFSNYNTIMRYTTGERTFFLWRLRKGELHLISHALMLLLTISISIGCWTKAIHSATYMIFYLILLCSHSQSPNLSFCWG